MLVYVYMKTILHRSDERGGGDYGWLKTRYSFSFNDWYDENKMGFGNLRVLNDDVIQGGKGFGTHAHKDMEIITLVTQGAVRHEDSMGNKREVKEGDVQVMSAGTGVRHSEYNGSETESLELFQLWIEPKVKSIKPSYREMHVSFKEVHDTVKELVGPGTLLINQDAYINYAALSKNLTHSYTLHTQQHGIYIFVIEGEVVVNTIKVGKRDAIGVWDTKEVTTIATTDVRFLLIEVPM